MKIGHPPLFLRKFGLASALLAAVAGKSAAANSFYQGKVLTLVCGCEAGSSYDLYSRLLAQYLPKYIPGHPMIVVQDMPGASGLVSANYMYKIAPHDGTMIASATSLLPIYPPMHPDMTNVDVTRFSWIGSVTKDNYVPYVWYTAPVQSYEEAKHTPLIVGGLTIGAPTVDLAVISNALFGTKFKIVSGYQGENAIKLAM